MLLPWSVLFIQYIQQFYQFCANAVIGKIASSAQLYLSSASALLLLLLQSGFSIVRYPCSHRESFCAIESAYIYAFAKGSCHLSDGKLIYSLQIKSGVENQLVCTQLLLLFI